MLPEDQSCFHELDRMAGRDGHYVAIPKEDIGSIPPAIADHMQEVFANRRYVLFGSRATDATAATAHPHGVGRAGFPSARAPRLATDVPAAIPVAARELLSE